MTREDLADRLQGIQYDSISDDLIALATDNNLVIVYGYSDDLIEFDGAISDEAYVEGWSVVAFDRGGIIPAWEDIEHDEIEEVRAYLRRVDESQTSKITAIWNRSGYSWIYETDIPHSTFEMYEDEDKYCRGIVFSVEDVGGF